MEIDYIIRVISIPMNHKPTPPQAIMLRELSAVGASAHAELDSNHKCYRAWGCNLVSTPNLTWLQINPATFGVLIRHGWVVRTDQKYILSQIGRETLAVLGGSDFELKRPAFTADEIGALLRTKYPAEEWIFFEELRFGTGYGRNAETEIDAWAMNTWPSKGFLKIAFEIKIYRSDFLKEIQDPNKRKPALSISNQFYFIGPKGLMSKHEMPDECGLMEISPDGAIKTAKTAPERKISEPTWNFIASLARRIQKIAEE